jgi:hypothetical protein
VAEGAPCPSESTGGGEVTVCLGPMSAVRNCGLRHQLDSLGGVFAPAAWVIVQPTPVERPRSQLVLRVWPVELGAPRRAGRGPRAYRTRVGRPTLPGAAPWAPSGGSKAVLSHVRPITQPAILAGGRAIS